MEKIKMYPLFQINQILKKFFKIINSKVNLIKINKSKGPTFFNNMHLKHMIFLN